MHPLEKRFLRHLRQNRLIDASGQLVAAVSGGPDSMAMLHLLIAAGLPATHITAVHVNHQLRLDVAEREAELARTEAARLGVFFVLHAVDTRGHARRQKISIEESARELRYQALRQTAASVGAAKIAVAHTADDQAEEVLLRLIRGTGRKGLSGMAASSEGNILRPLLGFRKDELVGYLNDKKIPFSIDQSNFDRRHLRNRVRLDLLPLLEKDFNSGIRRTLIRTANILSDEEALLATLAANALPRCVPAATGSGEDEELALLRTPFLAEPAAIQRRILEQILWQLAAPPSFTVIETLRQLAAEGSAGQTSHLGNGLRITVAPESLIFLFPAGRRPLRGNLDAQQPPVSFRYQINAPGSLNLPEIGRTIFFEFVAPSLAGLPPDAILLDADSLSFPLIIRSFQPGDRFHPLGASGGKKVGDFFTDRKIPASLRPLIPVIEANGVIVALAGLRAGHAFRLTPESRNALKITLAFAP